MQLHRHGAGQLLCILFGKQHKKGRGETREREAGRARLGCLLNYLTRGTYASILESVTVRSTGTCDVGSMYSSMYKQEPGGRGENTNNKVKSPPRVHITWVRGISAITAHRKVPKAKSGGMLVSYVQQS